LSLEIELHAVLHDFGPAYDSSGSIAALTAPKSDFRLTRGLKPDIAPCPKSAQKQTNAT